MKTIGVMGLGNMGIGMAKNLLKSGHNVVGFDLRSSSHESLSKLGGTAATGVVELAQQCESAFLWS